MSIFHGSIEIADGNLHYGDTPIAEVYVGAAKVWPPPPALWWDGGGVISDANCIQHLEDISPATALVETAGIPIAAGQPNTVIVYQDVTRRAGNDTGQILWHFSGSNLVVQGAMVYHDSRQVKLIDGYGLTTWLSINFTDTDPNRIRVFFATSTDGADTDYRTVAGTDTDRIDNRPMAAAQGIGYTSGDLYSAIGSKYDLTSPMLDNLNNLAIYDIELSTAQINAVMAQLTA